MAKRRPDVDPREIGAERARRQIAKAHGLDDYQGSGVVPDEALNGHPDQGRRARRRIDPQGTAVALVDPDPWPDPVDGAQLLNALAAFVMRRVVLPDGAAWAVALWILHTYTLDAAQVTPILLCSAPVKRCGKTRLLTLLGALTSRALTMAHTTPAALFRAVEKYHPTVLIDEGDSFLTDNEDLRGLLNSGHTRTSAYVLRADGDSHDVRLFSTWAAKAIAMIKLPPETIRDRAIPIAMDRKAPGDRVRKIREDQLVGQCLPLRRQAQRWAEDHTDTLRDADPAVPQELDDRQQDNWRPLMAIAAAAKGKWSDRARAAALTTSGLFADEDSAPILCLSDIRALLAIRGVDRLPSTEIVTHLATLEDRRWPEWNHGKPMSATALAKLLKPFGVKPTTLRMGDQTPKGYYRSQFVTVFARYLPKAL